MPIVADVTSNSSTAASSARTGDDAMIDIDPEQQEEILATVNMTVDDVLDSMVSGRPMDVEWRHKVTKRGVAYYVDDNVGSGQYRFCCVSHTSATTEEIMKLFLITDTAALQRHARILYDNVLDMKVLSVLEEPSELNPYKSMFIRYTSLAAPKPLGNRDMCLAVATDMFTHEDGSTIGYCLWDSVDIPQCPKAYGLIRSRMFRSGYLCRTTSNGFANGNQTEIIYFVGVEAGGLAPRLATKMVMERFGANLMRLCNHFRRKKLDPATFCPREEWMPTREATNCRCCVKKFNRFSKRRNCASCGDVFCSPCCSKEDVDIPGVGFTTMRFCLRCLGSRGVESKDEDPPRLVSFTHRDRAKSMPRLQPNIENPFFRIEFNSDSNLPSPTLPPLSPILGRTIVLPTWT